MELLAERPLLGWPGVTVELHTNMKLHTVRVGDKIVWQGKNKKDAKDAYFHPFAYGLPEPELDKSSQT